MIKKSQILFTILILCISIDAKNLQQREFVPNEFIIKLSPDTKIIPPNSLTTGIIEVDIVLSKISVDFDMEIVKKIQECLPGKKQAMFEPIPEDEAISKSEIDEAKGIIKEILKKKIESGDFKIEDILAVEEPAE